MKKILPVVALFALSPLAAMPVAAETLPSGIPPSAGLIVGWNTLTPSYCYTFAYGAETIVKLVSSSDVVIQSNTPASTNAMMAICASGKRYSVYSNDGTNWQGIFVSAYPGG